MIETLGPHTVHCVAPSGKEGVITLTIIPGPARRTDLGRGSVLEEVTASIDIVSDWFSKTITFHGIDDIQLVFRLLWMADIHVQKICRDNQYEVYRYQPGDVDRAFGIYN